MQFQNRKYFPAAVFSATNPKVFPLFHFSSSIQDYSTLTIIKQAECANFSEIRCWDFVKRVFYYHCTREYKLCTQFTPIASVDFSNQAVFEILAGWFLFDRYTQNPLKRGGPVQCVLLICGCGFILMLAVSISDILFLQEMQMKSRKFSTEKNCPAPP